MSDKEIRGSICGGVISNFQFLKDPEAYMMSFVMPDKQYDKYVFYKKQGKEKEAKKLFDRYAMSQI